jgi:hypothetical protein
VTGVPTSFLKLIGVNSLHAGAMAIAWAAQPITVPPAACVFPAAVSQCYFQSAGGPTSLGCGATATFIASSPGSTVGGNSAAWASVVLGQSPNDPNILGQVQTAAGGDCSGSSLNTGDHIPVNGGQLDNVINWLMKPNPPEPTAFPAKYAASSELVVLKQDNSEAYRGKGWEVYVPVIDTGPGCPPSGPITGEPPITGWTRFVITQVLGKNGECAVANHWTGDPSLPFGNAWDSMCFETKNGKAAPGATTVIQGATGVFGYYNCQYSPVPPAPTPGPITATAKLKLVK